MVFSRSTTPRRIRTTGPATDRLCRRGRGCIGGGACTASHFSLGIHFRIGRRCTSHSRLRKVVLHPRWSFEGSGPSYSGDLYSRSRSATEQGCGRPDYSHALQQNWTLGLAGWLSSSRACTPRPVKSRGTFRSANRRSKGERRRCR